jgi:hypothetical protein
VCHTHVVEARCIIKDYTDSNCPNGAGHRIQCMNFLRTSEAVYRKLMEARQKDRRSAPRLYSKPALGDDNRPHKQFNPVRWGLSGIRCRHVPILQNIAHVRRRSPDHGLLGHNLGCSRAIFRLVPGSRALLGLQMLQSFSKSCLQSLRLESWKSKWTSRRHQDSRR